MKSKRYTTEDKIRLLRDAGILKVYRKYNSPR